MNLYLQVLIGTLLLFIVWSIYTKIICPILERNRLIKQGVVFLDRPFSELAIFKEKSEAQPFEYVVCVLSEIIAASRPGKKMPPMTGICIPGICIVSINSAELLEDIFVNHN